VEKDMTPKVSHSWDWELAPSLAELAVKWDFRKGPSLTSAPGSQAMQTAIWSLLFQKRLVGAWVLLRSVPDKDLQLGANPFLFQEQLTLAMPVLLFFRHHKGNLLCTSRHYLHQTAM